MMTALLLKDFYTLAKQTKVFLLIIVVFALIPGYAVSTMAVIYAAMLPMTALAYDERAKWDSLAAMMPYSAKKIVLGKYLLGYFAVIGTCILNVAAQLIIGIVKNTGVNPEFPMSLLLTACFAITLLAINLPLMIKFGIEKGRILFLVLFGIIGALVMFFNDKLDSLLTGATANLISLLLVAPLVAVIVNVLSILLSTTWYKRKAL